MTLDADGFADIMAGVGHPVSRETLDQLTTYLTMLHTWQSVMNLVGPSTLADAWQRHVLDSAQLVVPAGAAGRGVWLDVGTGAGFPGLVLAMLGARHVHLVESVAKKCRFLDAVIAATGLGSRVTVHHGRAEDLGRILSPVSPDFITSRACAPLARLIPWVYAFHVKSTRWLLLKGQDVDREVQDATTYWQFSSKLHPSLSDPRGRVLALSDVRPRPVRNKK